MKKQILLIDDDAEEVKTFMAAIAELEGAYSCDHAVDTDEAIAMLREEKHDFVFVDYHLPKLSGLHLLSFIKNDRRLQRTKVFIYTEMISDEIDKMARLLGASGCMEKKGTVSWLKHQFRAIFAGELLPSYTLLRLQ